MCSRHIFLRSPLQSRIFLPLSRWVSVNSSGGSLSGGNICEFCADCAEETEVNADATLTAGEADRGSDDDVERECEWVLGSQWLNGRPCKDRFESTRNVLCGYIMFCGVDCCCWKRLDSTKLFGVWERVADVG